MAYQLTIESPGPVGIGLVRLLQRHVPYSQGELTQRLFRAPSVILEDLEKDAAQSIRSMMEDIGVLSRVEPQGRLLEDTSELHEVSVFPETGAVMNELSRQLMTWLGCDFEQARQLLCEPCGVVVGRLSRSAADALAETLKGDGRRVVVQSLQASLYDILLSGDDCGLRAILDRCLPGHMKETAIREGDNLIAISDLNYPDVQVLWHHIERHRSSIKVLNQAYGTFEVILNKHQPGSGIGEVLEADFGIPAKVHSKLLASLPVSVKNHVAYSEVKDVLDVLRGTGAEAEARLCTYDLFRVKVTRFSDATEVRKIAKLLGVSLKKSGENLESLQPVTVNQSLWLSSELRKVGAVLSKHRYQTS